MVSIGQPAPPMSLTRRSTVRSITTVPSRYLGRGRRRGGDGDSRRLPPDGVLDGLPRMGSDDIDPRCRNRRSGTTCRPQLPAPVAGDEEDPPGSTQEHTHTRENTRNTQCFGAATNRRFLCIDNKLILSITKQNEWLNRATTLRSPRLSRAIPRPET